jgi:hypothetical protein
MFFAFLTLAAQIAFLSGEEIALAIHLLWPRKVVNEA